MTATEILKTILENSSLLLKCFEYEITKEDILKALEEISKMEEE